MNVKLNPIHPGEILWHDFMEPLGITKYRLAKEIGVLAQRIGEIVAGRRAITADTDLRLCRFFGFLMAIGCADRRTTIRRLRGRALRMRWRKSIRSSSWLPDFAPARGTPHRDDGGLFPCPRWQTRG